MSSASRIGVMVVDDHPIVRNGLRDVLEASGHLEVVGQAADGDEAVETAEGLGPDVIVMDVAEGRLRLPDKVVREVFAWSSVIARIPPTGLRTG